MSKSIGNLKINNAKKIEKINRTCQNTALLTARAIHGTVTDIGNVNVDGWVKQRFPTQKMKAKRTLPTASEPPIHRNKWLRRACCSRISENFIAKNKRRAETRTS